MTRILLVGYDPETEDFSEPGRPSGLTADKIEAGIEFGVEQMRERGWEVDVCKLRFQETAETAGAIVDRQLRSAAYDCVVIGGGIRLPMNYLVFEAVINAVHRGAPAAVIAFNSGPEESADAAGRWLTTGQNRPEPR
jgi:hypothetical protein